MASASLLQSITDRTVQLNSQRRRVHRNDRQIARWLDELEDSSKQDSVILLLDRHLIFSGDRILTNEADLTDHSAPFSNDFVARDDRLSRNTSQDHVTLDSDHENRHDQTHTATDLQRQSARFSLASTAVDVPLSPNPLERLPAQDMTPHDILYSDDDHFGTWQSNTCPSLLLHDANRTSHNPQTSNTTPTTRSTKNKHKSAALLTVEHIAIDSVAGFPFFEPRQDNRTFRVWVEDDAEAGSGRDEMERSMDVFCEDTASIGSCSPVPAAALVMETSSLIDSATSAARKPQRIFSRTGTCTLRRLTRKMMSFYEWAGPHLHLDGMTGTHRNHGHD